MTGQLDPEVARRALVSRLRTVAGVLLPGGAGAPSSRDSSREAARLLDALVRRVKGQESAGGPPSSGTTDTATGELWLLFIAVAAAYPTSDELIALRRAFALSTTAEASVALLTAGLNAAVGRGSPESQLRLVTDTVLVDVDFSARHDLHTGIQRVVRSTIPLWAADRPVTLAAWTSGYGAYRDLLPAELDRVRKWGDDRDRPRRRQRADAPDLLVPWGTAVVLAEVPDRSACDQLAALARYSANSLVGIGYDCIPIVSADLLPAVEGNRFVKYLSALKYAHSMAGISASATAEFAGFGAMLAAQGIAGPTVFEVGLPAPAVIGPAGVGPAGVGPAGFGPVGPDVASRPVVLCVGSFEPRKNQIAVLHAAELLWREGLDFELTLIGGGGSSTEMRRRVGQLSRAGRRVSTRTGISEAELASAYRSARFTVFPSLHEGYGLPVVESLAQGTPVVTTDFGSPAEIGRSGGTVLVDPRDDRALAAAMRRLLTDDELLAELRDQIQHRAARSWTDYADELWQRLCEPALAAAVLRLPSATLAAPELVR